MLIRRCLSLWRNTLTRRRGYLITNTVNTTCCLMSIRFRGDDRHTKAQRFSDNMSDEIDEVLVETQRCGETGYPRMDTSASCSPLAVLNVSREALCDHS